MARCRGSDHGKTQAYALTSRDILASDVAATRPDHVTGAKHTVAPAGAVAHAGDRNSRVIELVEWTKRSNARMDAASETFQEGDMSQRWDVIFVGGGFYGVYLALSLHKRGLKVLIIERELGLMRRASYANQARVHGGYHYPRNFQTAFRSRVNLERFVAEFGDAVVKPRRALYAIARRDSFVGAKYFAAFCERIGAPLEAPSREERALFSTDLIEDVFRVKEYAFDSSSLRLRLQRQLETSALSVQLGIDAVSIRPGSCGHELGVEVSLSDGTQHVAGLCVNATYSGVNRLRVEGEVSLDEPRVVVKHELTEMALIEPPVQLRETSITVMDGPFFSMMPFPSRQLYTLSHVRYTPHGHWHETLGRLPPQDPYTALNAYGRNTRAPYMLADSARYVPALRSAKHIDSLFEVKTVLARNESDDGRPILFQEHAQVRGFLTVLGSKLDNVFDVEEVLLSRLGLGLE